MENLNNSQIKSKDKSRIGLELTKNRLIPFILSSLVIGGCNLGLAAPAFSALFSSSAFTAAMGVGVAAGVISGVSLTANGIRHLINYNQYKKFLNVENFLTNDEIEAVRKGEVSLENLRTEKLINKLTVSSKVNPSELDIALGANDKYFKTFNPFKRLFYYNRELVHEDFINKSLYVLVNRLNDLSVYKKGWKKVLDAKTNKTVIKDASNQIVDAHKQNLTLDEMNKIQTFLAVILDKTKGRDAYYRRLKNLLKKHHETIELVTIPETDSAFEVIQNDITNELRAGKVDRALRNFCLYAKNVDVEALHNNTKLSKLLQNNADLKSTAQAKLEAVELTEDIKSLRLEAKNEAKEIERIKLGAKTQEVEIHGAHKRVKLVEENALKVDDELNTIAAQWAEMYKTAVKEYQDIINNAHMSNVYVKNLKGILANSIQDRMDVKSATNEIRKVLKQAKREDLTNRLVKLLDLVFVSENNIKVIEANKNRSNKLIGKMGNELGKSKTARQTAEDEAKLAQKARQQAQYDSYKTKKSATDAEQFAFDAVGHASVAEDAKNRAEKSAKEAKRYKFEAAEDARLTKEHKEEAENSLSKINKVVVALKEAKADDFATVNKNINIIVKEYNKLVNIVGLQGKELEKVRNDSVMDVEACYEFLGREIASIYDYLRDLDLPKINRKLQDLSLKLVDLKLSAKQQATKQSALQGQVTKIRNSIKEIKSKNDLIGFLMTETSMTKEQIKSISSSISQQENSTLALEETVAWLTQNVANLQADNVLLASALEEAVNSTVSYNKAEEEKAEKYSVPKTKEETDATARFKRYAHAVFRALDRNETLPEREPKTMKNKKETQESIYQAGGKNISFRASGKIRKQINELCDFYLISSKDKQLAEKLSKLELSDMSADDIVRYIGLIEKATKDYNQHTFGL